jgi:hypothetical protein
VKLWFSKQSKNLETIDKQLKIEIQKEESYWQQVFHRLIETIIFLSSRGLAFGGNNQIIDSGHNGNYLGCFELIAKFDPLLSTYIDKYTNKGEENVPIIFV